MSEKHQIWFVVVNAYAASSHACDKWRKAESKLKESGIIYHMNRTGNSGNAMEIAFDACMAGYRKIVAAGGDGTVHDVLNGIGAFIEYSLQQGVKLTFSDFTLGVIPLGSGNDWIKSLSVPNDISKSVKLLSECRISKQDVVVASLLQYDGNDVESEISRTYMANVAGVGIDARVCEIVNAQKKRGKRGKILYVIALIKAIRKRVPSYVQVECDGQVVYDGPCLSIAFGVGKYSGGGMRQTPDAVIDDGLLDMTIIPELPILKIAKEAPRLFTGTFLQVKDLVYAKSRTITVLPKDASSVAPVEVDGEVVGHSPVRFKVLDSQINVVVG